MIEPAGRFRVAVLDHGRIFAELDGKIGTARPRDAHGLGALQPLTGVNYRLFQAGRRHQRLELVGAVDHHEHARAGVARLLEPTREQRDVQADQHVRRLDCLQRSLAAAYGLHAHLGP